jgi:DeoR/GlpR family transcriptional regulator of sugar metabolism
MSQENIGAEDAVGTLPIDKAKYVAARRAIEYVEDGMRVGLGTGSTAVWMVRCLAEMVREEGMMITTVATSTAHGGACAVGRPRCAHARRGALARPDHRRRG